MVEGADRLTDKHDQIRKLCDRLMDNPHFSQTNLNRECDRVKNLPNLQEAKEEMISVFEKVRQQILNSLYETTLNVWSNQLSNLPTEIGQLTFLKVLNLSNNKLTNLPKEIGQIHSLTKLFVTKNNLTNIPAEIGQLHSLTTLELSDNKLTKLPAEIGQLHSLTELNLRNNQLTSLPLEIGQLHSLKYLDLYGNQLRSLPGEFGQLHSLKNLNLGGNQLRSLPAEFGQLHSLNYFDLSYNQLTSLPAEVRQLHSLGSLFLEGNPIQDLSALANHPNQYLQVYCSEIALPRRYWTHLNQWKAEWLLTEENAEVRRFLIQHFGYDRIIQELGASAIDNYREYTLLKIDADVDVEPIHLLKMTCPSTGHIHVLRVPPNLTSARDAIRWVNWDIDPEAFAVET